MGEITILPGSVSVFVWAAWVEQGGLAHQSVVVACLGGVSADGADRVESDGGGDCVVLAARFAADRASRLCSNEAEVVALRTVAAEWIVAGQVELGVGFGSGPLEIVASRAGVL